jgi:predicted negative regulator of RcsB-dependent stress response
MKTITPPDSKTAKAPISWWICAGLVLAIFTAYWPVMGYAFTDFDDPQYVSKNPQVLNGLSWLGVVWAFTHVQVNWHPLTWLSHMLDVQLFGLNAGGHHATSMLFHAANTVLVFLWLRQLTGFLWRGALVAALFGLHPLHVESVAWIAERKDVLSTFFFLLTLMAYTRYVQRSGVRSQKLEINLPFPNPFLLSPSYWFALVFFALGLMSKPMVVTLPFVLLLLDFWPLNRIGNFKRIFLEKVPFVLLSAASCVVTFMAQQNGKAMMPITLMPAGDRVENAFIAYTGYIQKMFWPDSLAVFYPLTPPIDTILSVVSAFGLLLVSGVIFILRRQRPYLVTGWLWYLGTLVPVIGLIQVGSQAMADRYSYIPLIGIFIALTWLLAEISTKWPYRRLVLTILSTSMLATCWKLAATQVCYWQNSEILARHALAVTSKNSIMQLLLGDTFYDHGKFEEAREHFAEAVRISPDNVPAQCGLAMALVVEGRLDEANDVCRKALQIQPSASRIHYVLGNILSRQGRWAEAVTEYKLALNFDPNQVLAMNDLAWLLATAPDARFRDGPEAVRLGEKACQLSNYQVTLYVGTLAAAYAESGHFDDAVKTAERAVALATAAKNDGLAKKNRELLELYQLKKPYHQ